MSIPRRRSRFRSVISEIREDIAENDARLDAIEEFLGINNFTMSEEGNVGIGSSAPAGNVGVGSSADGNVGVGSTSDTVADNSNIGDGNVGNGNVGTGNVGIGT